MKIAMDTMLMPAHQVASLDLCDFRILGGKTWYEAACHSRDGRSVRISRLEQLEFPKLRQINRWVDCDCIMEVNIEHNIPQLKGFGLIK